VNGNTLGNPSADILSRKRFNKTTNKNIARKQSRVESVNAYNFIEINASLKRGVVWYYRKNMEKFNNYHTFLGFVKSVLIDKLHECVRVHPIKYNLKLEATYDIPNVETSSQNRAFKTSARELFAYSDIEAAVDSDFLILHMEEDVYANKGSGYNLSHIDGLLLGVYKYSPLGGSSYIPLPQDIIKRRAVINPQNIDHQCFKWAILAKHVQNNNSSRVDINYFNEEYRYDFSRLTTPTPVSETKIFERCNPDTSVNVYGIQFCKKLNTNLAYPIRVVDEEKTNHFDLLLVNNLNKNHYAYISNFSRLVRNQKTLYEHELLFCKKCFTSFDSRPRKYKPYGMPALVEHRKICGVHKPILPVMPTEGSTLKFKAWCKTQRLPFVIYADFEALLLKITERYGENTQAFHSHRPMSYGFIVKTSENVSVELLERYEIPQTPIVFRGSEACDDVARQFVLAVTKVADRICKLLKATNVAIIMSDEDSRLHSLKTGCDLCNSIFNEKNCKVAHHDHLSGEFLKTLCNTCNLKLKTQKFVPCFLHNLSKYDAHFIVTELGYDNNRISVIPNSEENFISFTKYINNEFTIRFIDTCRFMASSLSSLVQNLSSDDFIKFREIAKVFTSIDMPLVTRKGVYPYEYTDSWSKLSDTSLPGKSEFYSTLTESHIEDVDYTHAIRVWDHFKCRTLGEYSDLYLKIDVLLLADVFENFRDICISTYNLDPAYYYTAPGFSFDCMLKYTSINLDLLTDYEMLLMIEQGIRGGLVQASMRYAKANNYKTPTYDNEKPKSWLIYQDCKLF